MTRAVRFHEFGGPDVLRIEEVDLPQPGPGEVALEVQSIGINRSEVNFRHDRYLDRAISLPSGLGYEGTGRIIALGPDVDSFEIGDEVCVLPVFRQSEYHLYAEESVVPARALVRRPASVDVIVGAAAWMPYLTVYGALVDIARLRAGDRVVITAATSSVGYAAIHVARRAGAVPIAVTEHPHAEQRLLQLGAERVIVLGRDDLAAVVTEESGGRGAEVVFDAVAGPGVEELAAVVAKDGILFIHGSLSGEPTPMPGLASLRSLWVRPYSVFDITNDPERFRRAKEYVAGGLSSGAFRPVIDEVYGFDDIVDAHRRMESPDRFGKIVVTTRHAQLTSPDRDQHT